MPKITFRLYPILMATLLIWPALLLAQSSSTSELTGQQVVEVFDFEERDIHFDLVPMHWRKYTDQNETGFAHYSLGKLDDRHQRSGQYSFELISDGSSVGFNYHRRRLQARPGNDFSITAYVHLEHAEYSRARLSCSLTDRTGRTIEGSTFESPLVGIDDQDENGWARLDVYLPGSFPQARYMTMGLWLLQERQWNRQAVGSSRILHHDINARAWFDDISITQLPRVILKTNQVGHVFPPNEPVALIVEVEGVGVANFQVNLVVHDAEQTVVSEESWILSGLEGTSNTRTIPLGDLLAGLYHSTLSIISNHQIIATRELTFAKVASLTQSSALSGSGFGISTLHHNAGNWPVTIQLAKLCNAKLLKIPVWREDQKQRVCLSDPDFESQLLQLQKNNIEVIASFSEVPASLATQLNYGHTTIFDAFSQDPTRWQPQVSMILAQYARQIPYWQIGFHNAQNSISWDPRIKPIIQLLKRHFNEFIINPDLSIPLSSFFEINSEQAGSTKISLHIPTSILPQQIPEIVAEFKKQGFSDISATITPLDATRYKRDHRLIDFAKRLIMAKKSNSHYIFTHHPWTPRQVNARSVVEPTELLLITRTLSDLLSHTKYMGKFYITPDIVALIFQRDKKEGILITWHNQFTKDLSQKDLVQSLTLGGQPEQMDLFGNRTPLETVNNKTKVRITDWPTIITGINPQLAQLRASLSISPDSIAADITRQSVQLQFSNPFNTTISGRLRFIRTAAQENWEIDPLSSNFVISPGQTFDQITAIKFPRSELGGKKKLAIQMLIDADRTYRLTMDIPFEIRMDQIDLSYFARRINDTDLLVQKVITNNSQETVSLTSYVDLPDQNRMERSISRLQPGEIVKKSYLIPNAVQWRGKSLRLGLYDPKGTKRINYRLPIN